MELINDKIFTKCELVQESDLPEATKIGLEMLAYAKKNNFLCMAANQVGYDKQVCVVRDNDGYDVYINPEIELLKTGGEIQVSQETTEFPAQLESFPRKRVLVDVVKHIKVSAFSIEKDDRISFTTDDALAHIWQVVSYIMKGVNQDDIVGADFQTIVNEEPKKKPNEKCSKCGRKNKKCLC